MNDNVQNPFAITTRAEVGGSLAVSDQARGIAEVQAKLLMAQQFPRNEVEATDRILNAFTRPRLAEQAKYQYARGGTDIDGPSIRAAEAIAQQWGNFEFGFREVSRGRGADGVTYSEVEAYAWDLQARTRRPIQFQVRHWRDTKKGGYKLTDERDIYELMSNMAQRRVRACILAVVPGDVVEAAMEQVEVTLKSTADTSPEAMQKLVAAFEPFGVTKEMIEKRIQRRLDAIQAAQVVMLRKIFASLRDNMSTAGDWFEGAAEASAEPATSLKDIKAKKAPKAPDVPAAFDLAPVLARIATANDVETLGLYLDDLRETAPAEHQDAIAEAGRKRIEELEG